MVDVMDVYVTGCHRISLLLPRLQPMLLPCAPGCTRDPPGIYNISPRIAWYRWSLDVRVDVKTVVLDVNGCTQTTIH